MPTNSKARNTTISVTGLLTWGQRLKEYSQPESATNCSTSISELSCLRLMKSACIATNFLTTNAVGPGPVISQV